jgi:hypothetical protein
MGDKNPKKKEKKRKTADNIKDFNIPTPTETPKKTQ